MIPQQQATTSLASLYVYFTTKLELQAQQKISPNQISKSAEICMKLSTSYNFTNKIKFSHASSLFWTFILKKQKAWNQIICQNLFQKHKITMFASYIRNKNLRNQTLSTYKIHFKTQTSTNWDQSQLFGSSAIKSRKKKKKQFRTG